VTASDHDVGQLEIRSGAEPPAVEGNAVRALGLR
jgi:hypothetical protein